MYEPAWPLPAPPPSPTPPASLPSATRVNRHSIVCSICREVAAPREAWIWPPRWSDPEKGRKWHGAHFACYVESVEPQATPQPPAPEPTIIRRLVGWLRRVFDGDSRRMPQIRLSRVRRAAESSQDGLGTLGGEK